MDQRWQSGRGVVFWLGVLFLVCVVIQATLGGLGFMADSAYFAYHRNFVHAFELIPIIIAIVVWARKGPVWMRWTWLVPFILIGIQYALIGATSGYVRGLHVLNAFILSGLTLWLLLVLRPTLIRGSLATPA